MTAGLTLREGLPENSLDDLFTLRVKWIDFNPIPNATTQIYSCWLAPVGFKIGQNIPWMRCDSGDTASFSRVFYQQKLAADNN